MTWILIAVCNLGLGTTSQQVAFKKVELCYKAAVYLEKSDLRCRAICIESDK